MPLTDPTANIVQVACRRRPIVAAAGRVAAGIIVATGVGSLLARMLGIDGSLGPSAGLDTLPLVARVATTLLGLALWDLIQGGHRIALPLSAAILITGIGLLATEALGVAALGQRVSVTGGVTIVVASVALLVVAMELGLTAGQVLLGVAGIVLLSLSVTITIARVSGVLELNVESQIAATSYHMLLTGGLLGAYFALVVVTSEVVTGEPPPWLAWGSGIGVASVVLILWMALTARQRDQILAQTRLTAAAERQALLRQLENTDRTLERLATHLVAGEDIDSFRARFAAVIADVPGLLGGVWFPPGGQSPVPIPANLDVAEVEAALLSWLSDSAAAGPIALVPLDPESSRFVIVAAACGPEGCGGSLVTVISAYELFGPALTDTRGGFRVGLAGRTGAIDGSPEPPAELAPWRQAVSMTVGRGGWRVQAWPTAAGLRRLRSDLPATVLFMGLLVAGLLPVALRLGQVARHHEKRLARDRLSAALDRSTDGVWELDLQRGTATHSKTLWRHLHYDKVPSGPDDGWFSYVHPDDRERVETALQRHLDGETDEFAAEYRLRAGDGSWHNIVDRGRVVDRDARGRPLLVMGISADVTEASAAAAARAVSESRFRTAFDGSFHAQLLLDSTGRVVEVNRAAVAGSGAQADDVIGQPCWEVMWWARDTEAAERLRQAVAQASAGTADRFTSELTEADGTPLVLECVLMPVPNEQGETSQLLLESRDETLRRRAESALQTVSTLTTMGRLAARVAHEINNPLAGIQSAFLLVKDSIPPDHPHHRYVDAIEREVGRIAAVTRQLYETYRPESESTPEASVATLLADGAALLQQLNRRTGIRIDVDVTDVPPVIPLPSAMIRQVVFNLVQNAIDASPPSAVVSLRATVRDGRLEIAVRDQGPGVPPEIRSRIFEPFFSTKQRDTETGGMGLGLSLVHRSVAAVGGRITVDDANGGGALFVVDLPLDAASKGAPT